MHLNGSTEVDVIWQDALRHPDRYAGHLRTGLSRKSSPICMKVWEAGPRPYPDRGRLRAARRIRYMLAENPRRWNGRKETGGAGGAGTPPAPICRMGARAQAMNSAVTGNRNCRPKSSTVLKNAHPFLIPSALGQHDSHCAGGGVPVPRPVRIAGWNPGEAPGLGAVSQPGGSAAGDRSDGAATVAIRL